MTPSASFDKSEVTSPLFFSTFHSVYWWTPPIIEDLKARGYTRIAVVHDQNAFTQALYDYFIEEARAAGFEIVEDLETNPDVKDYRTEIARITNAEPDAIILWLSFWPNLGEFFKQADAVGLNLPVYTGVDVEADGFGKAYAEYVPTIRYPVPVASPGQAAFVEKYTAVYGKPPGSPSAASAYDAANLLVAALRSGAREPAEIAAYLRAVKNYPGVEASITFDELGQVSFRAYDLVVYDANE
jgi:branched-chain amino acid transport system substrate-binding protein